eukprot:6198823-Pleurochrysis_carterae.AAC.4
MGRPIGHPRYVGAYGSICVRLAGVRCPAGLTWLCGIVRCQGPGPCRFTVALFASTTKSPYAECSALSALLTARSRSNTFDTFRKNARSKRTPDRSCFCRVDF